MFASQFAFREFFDEHRFIRPRARVELFPALTLGEAEILERIGERGLGVRTQ
jgi:hypothetical protein